MDGGMPKLRARWDDWRQMWMTPDNQFLLNCHDCNKLVAMRRWGLAWCSEHEPYWSRRRRLSSPAHVAVAKAIRKGQLPHPTTLKCTDCGEQAKCYDHRDYDKPLEVDAVCRGCNARRGPAIQTQFLTRIRGGSPKRQHARK